MSQKRENIAKADTWNVEALYSSEKAWDKAFNAFAKSEAPYFPELQKYRGKLTTSKAIAALLETYFNIGRELEKLYTYAALRHDEDIANTENTARLDKIASLNFALGEEASWIQPELIKAPKSALQGKELQPYAFTIDAMLRMKKHTLDDEKEQLLALTMKATQAPSKAFSAINDADFCFGTVLDGNKKERELTHGNYALYLKEQDRELRRNAFRTYTKKYIEFENTLCELLKGEIQTHEVYSRAHKFNTCLDAALYPKNIDTAVYHTLIDTVKKNLAPMHEYIKLRKKVLKLKELHCYDMFVPLLDTVDMKFSYEESCNLIADSMQVMGKQYVDALKKGLCEQRWVDKYENKSKRSGAYSSGCYDSYPYILMNYKGTIRDLFTLAHEAGHSMHSYLSKKHQPYHYASYELFLAEIASTFAETLLTEHMLKTTTDKKERAYLIDQQLENIRSTLFRQTMFAEFELWLHTSIENNTPITPALLKEKYAQLYKEYNGESLTCDDEIAIEWARIPHFYCNFYVYQYATGISAALALADDVLHGNKTARDNYLKFLQSGGSEYPLDILSATGVDLRSPQPIEQAIQLFSARTRELAGLLGQ